MVMFSIISMDFFQLEAAQAGYLMSFFGILQMVSGHAQRGRGLPASLSGRPAWVAILASSLTTSGIPMEKHPQGESTQFLAFHPTVRPSSTCLNAGQ